MNSTAAVQKTATGQNRVLDFAKVLIWTVIVGIAVAFVAKYVFRYYLHYNQAAFTDPVRGAANYWAMRGWLLLHMTGGMLALLTGPWQFWSGFRRRHMKLHRWTGRLFLVGVGVGSLGAIRMAIATTFGWAFGFGLLGLAAAWLGTTGMAYYAIRKRLIQIHQEWMIRAYVVTFAFVSFRLLNDYGPTSRIVPVGDRVITFAWLCWAVPLLLTELILGLKKIRALVASRA